MKFVVNEWLPEYFLPAAEPSEKQLLQTFLTRFMENKDVLLVRNPSEFLRKIRRYPIEFENYPATVGGLRKVIKFILLDSDRCEFVDDEAVELPVETAEKLTVGNFSSDRYLFEAALFSDEKIIVTTDGKLKDQLADDLHFKVILLEDFLSDY